MAVRMAPLRVWIDSASVVAVMTAVAVAAWLGVMAPAAARAQLFSKPAAAAVQRPIPVLQPPLSTFDYPQHETLTYTVDWRVFTAGTAVFHLEQVGNLQKITATADSVGAVNLLFPVVDGFQSGFDLKTGCSTGFDKQTQEGRRKIASDLSL